MRKGLLVLLGSCLIVLTSIGQEVLSPLRRPAMLSAKAADTVLTLPFFDDFSDTALSRRQWQLGGTFVNQGYAPLPPTLGMATLDAFDAQGHLYPTSSGELFSGDTLLSMPIRLDSAFLPYARPLSADDSIYFSFFYLPGGGYGNMWQRSGDVPEGQDSLILEFYDAEEGQWQRVWATAGIPADSLFARTGSYWQFQDIAITSPHYLQAGFRFRFRNYCSLDNLGKNGLLSNADQWNIDYVRLEAARHKMDTAARDIAFVNPAPSLLRRYTAMPARQFSPDELADSLPLTITNRYTEELATYYGYQILSDQGALLHSYAGGYENSPVYWHGGVYQTSPAHARPPLDYTLPVQTDTPTRFTVVHTLREGVSGDLHTCNDTTRFIQLFDNYYAYDDGIPENGYGITSTSARVRLACRFNLRNEDTLTALRLYFNRTLDDQNADIRFLITVWDDQDGHPGNILYQDADRRRPLFAGFNQYVTYTLEQPLVVSGTLYIGLEQTSADYLNLGFDRNHDASQHILYLTGSEWQTSILQGALMIRPCFGQRATVGIAPTPTQTVAKAYTQHRCIVVDSPQPTPVTVYNLLGQEVYRTPAPTCHSTTPPLPSGLYLIRTAWGSEKLRILGN